MVDHRTGFDAVLDDASTDVQQLGLVCRVGADLQLRKLLPQLHRGQELADLPVNTASVLLRRTYVHVQLNRVLYYTTERGFDNKKCSEF